MQQNIEQCTENSEAGKKSDYQNFLEEIFARTFRYDTLLNYVNPEHDLTNHEKKEGLREFQKEVLARLESSDKDYKKTNEDYLRLRSQAMPNAQNKENPDRIAFYGFCLNLAIHRPDYLKRICKDNGFEEYPLQDGTFIPLTESPLNDLTPNYVVCDDYPGFTDYEKVDVSNIFTKLSDKQIEVLRSLMNNILDTLYTNTANTIDSFSNEISQKREGSNEVYINFSGNEDVFTGLAQRFPEGFKLIVTTHDKGRNQGQWSSALPWSKTLHETGFSDTYLTTFKRITGFEYPQERIDAKYTIS